MFSSFWFWAGCYALIMIQTMRRIAWHVRGDMDAVMFVTMGGIFWPVTLPLLAVHKIIESESPILRRILISEPRSARKARKLEADKKAEDQRRRELNAA